MSLSVDLLSVLLFVAIGNGIFLLSLIVIKHGLSRIQNVLLFALVLALIWFQSEFLSVRMAYNLEFNLFYGTRYGAWFLLGPIYYLYVRFTLTLPAWSYKSILPHFIPFLLFTLILPVVSGDFLSFRQVHYGMLSSFDDFNDSVSFLQYVYSTIFVAQFLHVVVYGVLSLITIRHYVKSVKNHYSTIDSGTIGWLKAFSFLLLMVVASVSTFLVIFFYTRIYNRTLDYLYVLPLAVLVYGIAYKLSGVQWPGVREEETTNTSRYEKSSLKEPSAREYQQQLETYMKTARPYLNNGLRLQELAEALNIPAHHLSQVINNNLQTTFYDYVNRHRVEEAKARILSGEDRTLLEIAFESGFNNKTSYTNAFRKFTGLTPLEFKSGSGVKKD